MSSWQHLLHDAHAGDHLVHLYGEDDGALVRSVASYVIEGIRRQDIVLVFATPAHTEGVRGLIASEGISLDDSKRPPLVHFVDATRRFHELFGGGEPDWNSVRDRLKTMLRDVRAERPGARLRAFGEMVGLLWRAGRREEAERLEACWNEMQAFEPSNLYCAYPINVYDSELEPTELRGIFVAHSHACAGSGTLFSTARQQRA